MLPSKSDHHLINLPTRPPQDCKVLVVDDDDRIVEVLSTVLGHDGYQILSGTDGHMALAAIQHQRPDVAVLDVLLPGIDGIEICRRVKEDPDTRFMPIILMTGFSAQSRQLDGLHSGADDFLSKPIDPLQLTSRVRSLLRTRQLYEQLEEHQRELERRVAERTEQLRSANERLNRLNQVKSNVLAIIAHELRTPLLKVKNALWLALEEDVSPVERAQLVKTVERSFDLLEYRIADVGVFADPTDLRLAPVLLSDVVMSAVQQVGILQPTQSSPIQVDVSSSLPPVNVDATAFSRALAHIIDNAVKFGEGKPVTVSATFEAGNNRLVTRDKGIGINEALKPDLFLPLHQGDDSSTRRFGGMGIGLALVKMIMDAHGIEMQIKSTPGSGTTVILDVPPYDVQ